jgi:hypothetical protein
MNSLHVKTYCNQTNNTVYDRCCLKNTGNGTEIILGIDYSNCSLNNAIFDLQSNLTQDIRLELEIM